MGASACSRPYDTSPSPRQCLCAVGGGARYTMSAGCKLTPCRHGIYGRWTSLWTHRPSLRQLDSSLLLPSHPIQTSRPTPQAILRRVFAASILPSKFQHTYPQLMDCFLVGLLIATAYIYLHLYASSSKLTSLLPPFQQSMDCSLVKKLIATARAYTFQRIAVIVGFLGPLVGIWTSLAHLNVDLPSSSQNSVVNQIITEP
jgi:hypothetical protein